MSESLTDVEDGHSLTFEALIHKLEFENQQYLKEIENEQQHIDLLEKHLKEVNLRNESNTVESANLEENVRALEEQNRHNEGLISSIEKTVAVLKDYEETLMNKISVLPEEIKTERDKQNRIIEKYKSKYDEYSSIYDTFPRKKELLDLKEKLSILEKREAELKTEATKLQEDIKFLTNKDVPQFKSLSQFVLHFVLIKDETNKLVGEIEKQRSEKHKLATVLKNNITEKSLLRKSTSTDGKETENNNSEFVSSFKATDIVTNDNNTECSVNSTNKEEVTNSNKMHQNIIETAIDDPMQIETSIDETPKQMKMTEPDAKFTLSSLHIERTYENPKNESSRKNLHNLPTIKNYFSNETENRVEQKKKPTTPIPTIVMPNFSSFKPVKENPSSERIKAPKPSDSMQIPSISNSLRVTNKSPHLLSKPMPSPQIPQIENIKPERNVQLSPVALDKQQKKDTVINTSIIQTPVLTIQPPNLVKTPGDIVATHSPPSTDSREPKQTSNNPVECSTPVLPDDNRRQFAASPPSSIIPNHQTFYSSLDDATPNISYDEAGLQGDTGVFNFYEATKMTGKSTKNTTPDISLNQENSMFHNFKQEVTPMQVSPAKPSFFNGFFDESADLTEEEQKKSKATSNNLFSGNMMSMFDSSDDKEEGYKPSDPAGGDGKNVFSMFGDESIEEDQHENQMQGFNFGSGDHSSDGRKKQPFSLF